MYKYRYPNDLAAKGRIFFWTPLELVVLGMMILGSVSAISKSGNSNLLLMTCAVAAFTAKVFPDVKTGWEKTIDLYLFFTTPQYYEYDGKVHKKAEKKKNSKSSNVLGEEPDASNDDFIKVVIITVIALVGMFGLSSYMNKLNVVEDEPKLAELEFRDTADSPIEWGSGLGSVSAIDYVVPDNNTIKAEPETIDSEKLGEQEVTYIVTDEEGSEKEFKHTFNVVDTKYPEVEFSEDTVTVPLNSEFDPNSNILSVSDPVDGALAKKDVTENNSYTVESDVITALQGTYTVKVKATDVNGNITEKTYSVVVAE